MQLDVITLAIDVHPNHSGVGGVHKDVIFLRRYAVQREMVFAQTKILNQNVSIPPPLLSFLSNRTNLLGYLAC